MERVISSDSHMMEPGDFWVQRIGKKFGDQTPRVVKRDTGVGYHFIAPGIQPYPVAMSFSLGASGANLKESWDKKGYESARPSGWDPVERLKDQEIDGLSAEVLYTTLGRGLFSLSDVELQQACFRAYNDWMAEFCAVSPRRLIGLGLVTLADVDAGVKEMERCAKLGLKGCQIMPAPPERSFALPLYDKVWAAASDLQLPLSLHAGTGRTGGKMSVESMSIHVATYMMEVHNEIASSLSTLVLGGVLERFPKLKFVSVEADIGWIPFMARFMDRTALKFGPMMAVKLERKPSEIMHDQFFATFQEDSLGVAMYKFFGADNFMWASDFPHATTTWPNSRKVIERDFEGVPDDVRRRITCENVRGLYGLE